MVFSSTLLAYIIATAFHELIVQGVTIAAYILPFNF
jgi:hypothetical protein